MYNRKMVKRVKIAMCVTNWESKVLHVAYDSSLKLGETCANIIINTNF